MNSQTCSNFSRSSSIDDFVASNQSRNDTESIMDWSFSLLNDHLWTSSYQNGDSFTVCTVLDHEHFLITSSKLEFFYSACLSELLSSDLLESRDDSGTSGHSNEFDIDSSNPSHSWKFVLEQQMVSLILETPLTKSHITSTLFQVLNHIIKILLLQLIKLPERLSTSNIQVMFSFGLWGFKRTSQDGNPGICNLFRHLRVREFLIN